MLLHDVGKPATRSEDGDGEIHFYDHEHVGARLAEERLRSLCVSPAGVEWVTTIVRHHLRPLRLSTLDDEGTHAPARFIDEVGEPALAVALYSTADQLGKGEIAVKPGVRTAAERVWAAGFSSVRLRAGRIG